MIKKLKNQFILVMMLSLFIVMAVLVGLINIVNARNIAAQAEATIEFLYQNSGAFPDDMPVREPKPDGQLERRFVGGGGHITPDTRFETSFFTAELDAEGSITRLDANSVASLSEEEVSQYIAEIISDGGESGREGYFRYRVFTEEDGGSTIVAVNCYQEMQRQRSLLLVSLGAGILCMAAVLVLVIAMSRRVVRPVEESVERQRRFITDAGHELKTPITVIGANCEVLQMELGESRWLDSIKNQTRRLNHLVRDLLELSMLDEQAPAQDETVNLSELTLEAAQAFEARARERELQYSFDIEEGIAVTGNTGELNRLVSILLDNAVKYSAGIVRVELKRRRRPQLTVYNTCEYLRPEAVSRLFERFYRADESRAAESGGSGIGLSIAKAIVDRRRGKITAESADGFSVTFTAVL